MRSLVLGLAILSLACAEPPRDEPAAPAAGSELTLLERGAEPRTVLRSLPPEPGEERRHLQLIATAEQQQGGLTGITRPPPLLLDLGLQRGRAQDGGLSVDFTGSPFTLGEDDLVEPQVLITMQAALDGTGGFSGRARIDRSHALEDFTFEHPDADNVQAQQLAAFFGQTLAQAAIRFPDQAVGKGASWSWTSDHRCSVGALVQQENVATLLEVSDRLVLEMTSTFRAERQVLKGPPLPEGFTLDVTALTGRGRARLVFGEGELLPAEAEASGQWDLRMIGEMNGIADTLHLLQDMRLSLTSR